MYNKETPVYLTGFTCPNCNEMRVFTRCAPPNAFRCYACNVSFIITNPSYLDDQVLEEHDTVS